MTSVFRVPREHLAWVEDFEQRHGRPPRILHIGNIANNAYVNSKILNQAGLWSDVLCHGGYHIMMCPEWREAEVVGDIQNENYPAWEQVDLCGYQRPRWFAQGHLGSCVNYLIARCDGHADAGQLWDRLCQENTQTCAGMRGNSQPHPPMPRKWWLRKILGRGYRCGKRALGISIETLRRLRKSPLNKQFDTRVKELCQAFRELFPERDRPLRAAELKAYFVTYSLWEQLIRRYDIVIGYSTDGFYPLLVNTCPYFAFEHGTIRNIPFQDDVQGKLCALTYRLAQEAFITNCDNVNAAQKLRLQRFRFLPHPLNETRFRIGEAGRLRDDIRKRLQCNFLLFHPSRQHWTTERDTNYEKGNDVLIEGFAAFVKQVCPTAGAVFVEWGQTVQASKALLERHNLTNRVLWIPPQPTPSMSNYIQASDVVADQFYIGTFGGITPKAMMLERPVLLHLEEEVHRWCFPELPPVIKARTPDEICTGLAKLYRNPDYARDLGAQGCKWYHKYYSNDFILTNLLEAFREKLSPPESPRRRRAPAEKVLL